MDRYVILAMAGPANDTFLMFVASGRSNRLADGYVYTGILVYYEGEQLEVWVPEGKLPAFRRERCVRLHH